MMKAITVDATIQNVDTVTDFVNEVLESHDCSLRAQTQIDVAIDELFSNIARYAYPSGTGTATVQVRMEPEDGFVTITFLDRGIPYDPLQRDDPDVTLSAEERSIGGLGIYLVKKSMDAVTYSYENGQNILTIRKKI